MGAWHDFSVATAGASAALTGLVFVALSINLSEIMAEPGLVRRAAEALLLLTMPLFLALVFLMPDQSREVTGGLVLVVAAIGGIPITKGLVVSGLPDAAPGMRRHSVIRWITVAVVLTAFVIGAVLLMTGSADGIRVVAFAMMLSIGFGIVDAWVLLVEILR